MNSTLATSPPVLYTNTQGGENSNYYLFLIKKVKNGREEIIQFKNSVLETQACFLRRNTCF